MSRTANDGRHPCDFQLGPRSRIHRRMSGRCTLCLVLDCQLSKEMMNLKRDDRGVGGVKSEELKLD